MKPVSTEKAVMMIEANNTLTFEVSALLTKTEIKKEVEEVFNVKVDSIKTLIRDNKKYAYVKLKKSHPAIDVATKIGLM